MSNSTKTTNSKMVTIKEGNALLDRLVYRNSWLTGGTNSEFLRQQYPEGMSECLALAQEMVLRPFNKAATKQGLKESLENMINVIHRTIEKWTVGNAALADAGQLKNAGHLTEAERMLVAQQYNSLLERINSLNSDLLYRLAMYLGYPEQTAHNANFVKLRAKREHNEDLEAAFAKLEQPLAVKLEVNERSLPEPTKYRDGINQCIRLEIEELDLLAYATITDLGCENIYMQKDGLKYYCKVYTTERYLLGEWDFASNPNGKDAAFAASTGCQFGS